MPRSHTCANCGRELVWVHGTFDERFDALVVVCPGCRTPVVRLPDRAQARRRRNRAVRTLVIQAIAACISLAVFTGVAGLLGEFIVNSGVTPRLFMLRPADYVADTEGELIGGLLITVATGIWLGIGFRHWERARVVVVFAAVLGVVIAFRPFMTMVDDTLTSLAGKELGPRRHSSTTDSTTVAVSLVMLAPTILVMLAAEADLPGSRWLFTGMTFRARLQRARKRRQAR